MITINGIASLTSIAFKISMTEMMGPSQARAPSRARHVAMWLAYNNLDKSLPQIGRFFGRDHSSTFAGVRRVEQKWKDDPEHGRVIARLQMVVDTAVKPRPVFKSVRGK